MGLTSHFRKFVRYSSQIAKLLTDLRIRCAMGLLHRYCQNFHLESFYLPRYNETVIPLLATSCIRPQLLRKTMDNQSDWPFLLDAHRGPKFLCKLNISRYWNYFLGESANLWCIINALAKQVSQLTPSTSRFSSTSKYPSTLDQNVSQLHGKTLWCLHHSRYCDYSSVPDQPSSCWTTPRLLYYPTSYLHS